MDNNDKLQLFNIEAFVRSEGVSADVIFLDSLIINKELSEEAKAEKISLLISNIKSRQ